MKRATNAALRSSTLTGALQAVLDGPPADLLTDEALFNDPLAVWLEMEVGLDDGQVLKRRNPTVLAEAAERLASQTGRDQALCREQLEGCLTLMSRSAAMRGGSGDRAFMAFKLNQFMSGAGHVHATHHGTGQRRVTLEGQQFDPLDGVSRLYPNFFCRNCGQEHHPVLVVDGGGEQLALPRSIDETPIDDPTNGERAGYLMPEPEEDTDFGFTGAPDDFPEEWTEPAASGLRLKPDRRASKPKAVTVDTAGRIGGSGRKVPAG